MGEEGKDHLIRELSGLLRRAQRGDRDALHYTVELLMPTALKAIRVKYDLQDADTEDAEQDAWLKVRHIVLSCDASRPEALLGLVFVAVDRMVLTKVMRGREPHLMDPEMLDFRSRYDEHLAESFELWPLTERQKEMLRAYRDAIFELGFPARGVAARVMSSLGIKKAELCRLRGRVRKRLKKWRKL